MTDLERAREILAGYPPETAQHVIAQALAAARREGVEVAFREGMEHAARIDRAMLDNAERVGAEEMRERAAHTARNAWIASREYIADQIAALPLTPEGPT